MVIFSVLISDALNGSVFADVPAHPAYLIWPNFAFYRGLYLFAHHCSAGLCIQTADIGPGSEWVGIFLSLYIETLVFLLLIGYLDAVLPKEYGVQQPLHFPILWLIKKFRGNKVDNDDALLLGTASDRQRVSIFASWEKRNILLTFLQGY